jgi:hypothetical protein
MPGTGWTQNINRRGQNHLQAAFFPAAWRHSVALPYEVRRKEGYMQKDIAPPFGGVVAVGVLCSLTIAW